MLNSIPWTRLPYLARVWMGSHFSQSLLPARVKPLSASLKLTENCQAKCVTCNYWQTRWEDGLYRKLGPLYQAFDGDYVKLAPGTTVARFTAEADKLAKQYPATGGQLFVADESVQDATAQRSIRPQAVALAIFALVLAMTRCSYSARPPAAAAGRSRDNPVLAALGLTRWQLLAAGLLDVTVTAAAGAMLAWCSPSPPHR